MEHDPCMVMLRSYISLLVGIVGNIMSIMYTPLQSREIPICVEKTCRF